ncbi:endonuclease/exonuclease/phosphatase family metal-dependent hydrolase [Rhizobium sp. BK275]|uniref:endonuclease/exonuclease/phosphatase family protein n=1 Tax=Rhizobium sp. BK275 TaxID=2587077 RepID=UPI00160E4942|nr:endonuclease/exonuclease/phosphatase family protein [Rhizobium sp. BK275]MBB3390857.1 endonuclease/exonuclease/phosphatase family metal-dependent hydrolase [Rhizobium sp. BK275]
MTSFSDLATGDRNLVAVAVEVLAVPSAAFFDEARSADMTQAEHDRLAAILPSLATIEVAKISGGSVIGNSFVVAAWNAERLKYHASSVELVRQSAADILLLTEADLGTARAGNRHTVADLARDLGMSYVFGVEFVELGLGNSHERERHKGQTNSVGFHGNGLLSRLPLQDAALIRLDDGGTWWTDAKDGQGRIGGRMAIAAKVETAFGPILAVSVHLESKTDVEDRAKQTKRLIEAVERLAGDLPVVIGGDFNTNMLPSGPREPRALEPLFGLLAEAGYHWETGNDFAHTRRAGPDGVPQPPFARLDWLFTRGLAVSDAVTVPAVDADGAAISDHELIKARFSAP